MQVIEKGRYRARPARDAAEVDKLQQFRGRCFGLKRPRDADGLDHACEHVVIETLGDARLVGTFRLYRTRGAGLMQGYAAQFYDLSALENFEGSILEVGRLCTEPGLRDADVLRLAWQVITMRVDQEEVRLLCGCASFAGTDAGRYNAAFRRLRAGHLAPEHRAPRIKARDVVRFAEVPDRAQDCLGATAIPPLLRSYLGMGAWVSDHAVIDRDLGTIHVFTGLEVDAIPEARKRLLRALS